MNSQSNLFEPYPPYKKLLDRAMWGASVIEEEPSEEGLTHPEVMGKISMDWGFDITTWDRVEGLTQQQVAGRTFIGL